MTPRWFSDSISFLLWTAFQLGSVVSKRARYLKWRVSCTFLRMGIPLHLHRPYPYCLHRWGFLHFRHLKFLMMLGWLVWMRAAWILRPMPCCSSKYQKTSKSPMMHWSRCSGTERLTHKNIGFTRVSCSENVLFLFGFSNEWPSVLLTLLSLGHSTGQNFTKLSLRTWFARLSKH